MSGTTVAVEVTGASLSPTTMSGTGVWFVAHSRNPPDQRIPSKPHLRPIGSTFWNVLTYKNFSFRLFHIIFSEVDTTLKDTQSFSVLSVLMVQPFGLASR